MYLAVDIGGTKTLVALFDDNGNIVKKEKLPTEPDFNGFLDNLERTTKDGFLSDDVKMVSVGVPGKVDRENGIGLVFGNLPWSNVPIANELKSRLNLPVVVENDANLAGLAAAHSYEQPVESALYITISTGIGVGFITDGEINPYLADAEAGFMQFLQGDKLTPWEDFASGQAIKDKFGALAKDIEDQDVWRQICENLALGLINLITVLQPNVIILGGGVGAHLEKYHDTLVEILNDRKTDQYVIPPIVKAEHAEESVIYGCYEHAKQNLQSTR